MPALAWACFCYLVIGWNFEPVGWLSILRVLLVFACLLSRVQPLIRAPKFQVAVAWGSAALPLLISTQFEGVRGTVGLAMTVVGSMIVALSCIELGRSFGVSPAVRPFVQTGIYRRVSHPMYLGHVILELGLLISSLTLRNTLLCLASWTLYAIRVRWEDRIFSQWLQLGNSALSKDVY